MFKIVKIQKTQGPAPSEGGDSDDTLGLKMEKPNGIWRHRRLLRVSLVALGGPSWGFGVLDWQGL